MADRTGISWTDSTLNVVIGCDKVSSGCDNCYAIKTAHRMQAHPNPKVHLPYAGTERDGEWTGKVNLVHDRLDKPLRWTRPRRIFVNAQSDLFHADVPDTFIAEVFAIALLAPQHTFQILTKRPGRMKSLLNNPRVSDGPSGPLSFETMVRTTAHNLANTHKIRAGIADEAEWPLKNVWLGVSVEDQKAADLRVPQLLNTPAAVRFLSCEPLLGPVQLPNNGAGLDWLIVGGESGAGARPMHPAWALSLLFQCQASGVAFHFKQWGEWAPRGRLVDGEPLPVDNERTLILNEAGNTRGRGAGSLTNQLATFSDGSWCEVMERVGVRSSGRVLDGRTHDDEPRLAHQFIDAEGI